MKIELTDDMANAIVVNELKSIFEYTCDPLTTHPEDAIMNYKVQEGIKSILEYYLPQDEYEKWTLGEDHEELRSETCQEVQRCSCTCR
jgi:hypothetical protein